MRILFIGGSGFVGRNVYDRLILRHDVYLMSRHRPDWLPEEHNNWIEGNITDLGSIKVALSKKFDVVVDFVGVMGQKEQTYQDVNVKGTSNLVEALEGRESIKLVYISAINSERTSTEYLRTKMAAEKNIMQHRNYLIIRPSVFYGEGDYLTKQLLETARKYPPSFPKSGPMCPVYIKDFAEVFEALLAQTGVFNVCSNERLTLGAMLNIVRKRLKKPPIPEAPLLLFGAVSPILEAMGVISAEQLMMLQYGFYREDTVLYKYVKKPVKYAEFVERYISPGRASSKQTASRP